MRSTSTLSLLFSITLAAAIAAAAEPVASTPPETAQVIEQLGLVTGAQAVRERAGWRPLRRIVVRGDFADAKAYLAPVAQGAEIIVTPTPEDAIAAAPGADAILGYCEPAVIAAAPQARWIQSFSAGVEKCVSLAAIRDRGMLMTNMQRALGPAMAEHGIALLLALSRHLDTYVERQQSGRWDEKTGEGAPVQVLRGKTLLIAGLGGIGTEVAALAHALGMRVLATRASDRPGPAFVEYVGKPGELNALAARADAVIAALPLTTETRGVFDAKFFAALKKGAYFVNLGRGQSVVTADLLAALQSGHLGGAGLDVTDPEPLPPDHPLWRTPRVIITPHMSSTSDTDGATRKLIVRENLRRYQAGEPLLSVVDIDRGY